jgi:hypothetical protein
LKKSLVTMNMVGRTKLRNNNQGSTIWGVPSLFLLLAVKQATGKNKSCHYDGINQGDNIIVIYTSVSNAISELQELYNTPYVRPILGELEDGSIILEVTPPDGEECAMFGLPLPSYEPCWVSLAPMGDGRFIATVEGEQVSVMTPSDHEIPEDTPSFLRGVCTDHSGHDVGGETMEVSNEDYARFHDNLVTSMPDGYYEEHHAWCQDLGVRFDVEYFLGSE